MPSPDPTPNTPSPTEPAPVPNPIAPDPDDPSPDDPSPDDPGQEPDGPTPPAEETEVLATLTFMDSPRYKTSGSATVIRTGSQLKLELAEDFKTSSGPDLYLWLVRDKDSPDNYFEIAPLKTFAGAQSFDINLVNLDDYEALYIWCEDFSVLFGSGVLEKP